MGSCFVVISYGYGEFLNIFFYYILMFVMLMLYVCYEIFER